MNDAGFTAMGVATVWLKLQRLSDNQFWNPAAIDPAGKWGATPVLLSITLGGQTNAADPVNSWFATTAVTLPDQADLTSGQYSLSAYAVENNGNTSSGAAVTFLSKRAASRFLGSFVHRYRLWRFRSRGQWDE
jgi:hypothetical protein